MLKFNTSMRSITVLSVLALGTQLVSAGLIDIDLVGNAGSGLLPGNEVGANTPVAPGADPSTASGGERNAGFLYDSDSNELEFDFEFSGLSGGLFDAASGIHLHLANPGVDPFNETGGIAFNLNSGADANVVLDTPTIAIGSSGGFLAGVATLTEGQEADLLAGRYYLNIHSGEFSGGELRANLVPEPSSLALLLFASAVCIRRRKAGS